MIFFLKKRISICREIQAPAEVVWAVFTDTHLWPKWGASVLEVDCNDRYIKMGSAGRVRTLFSFWLPFTITTFRHMDFWSWRIGPLDATGHKIITTNENSCKLCFDMAWWFAAYMPICWFALFKIDKIVSKKKDL